MEEHTPRAEATAPRGPNRRRFGGAVAPAVLAVFVAIFYWTPMTSPSASIQWDAADVHYPLQKYVSDRILAGHLPFWTPYLFSGYPLLANPKVGAWYPMNWPFLVAGITPRSIQYEIALNAFLACLGVYFLFRRLEIPRAAALLGALTYGLSGFFASHSAHIGLFGAAACFPWLLLAYRRAIESSAMRYACFGAIAGGIMYLTGHIQGAIFGFIGLGLFALADMRRDPKRRGRILGVVTGMLAGALALSAVQALPALELTHQSVAAPSYSAGSLLPKSLLTLIYPNAMGTISSQDQGHITEHYYYAGLLLLPLVFIGVRYARFRLTAVFLIVPIVWYLFGPHGGLYFAGAIVPGLQTLGPPVAGWFVAGLGLALLAASGAAWLFERWRRPYAAALLVAIMFADLWYFNSYRNPLAYAHQSYEDLYGLRERAALRSIVRPQFPLTRFEAPGFLPGLGPMLHPLDMKFETTYGYLVLEPNAYHEYREAIRRNPKLRGGLNVARFVNTTTGTIDVEADLLPRAYFPPAVVDVESTEESLRALDSLNPGVRSIVLAPHEAIRQDPAAKPFVVSNDEQSYRIHYQTATPSLLKLSVAWFPGWHARMAGRELPVLHVDHALMGVVVPMGEGVVEFRFRPNYFAVGAVISILSLCCLLILAWIKHHHRITGKRARLVRRKPKKQPVYS